MVLIRLEAILNKFLGTKNVAFKMENKDNFLLNTSTRPWNLQVGKDRCVIITGIVLVTGKSDKSTETNKERWKGTFQSLYKKLLRNISGISQRATQVRPKLKDSC